MAKMKSIGGIIMDQNTKKMFEEEIVESLLNEIEISILKLKDEIKGIAANSIKTIAMNPRQGVYRDITSETEEKVKQDIDKYKELLSKIQNQKKVHKYIKNNRGDYQFLFENWICSENMIMDDLNVYISKSFSKKELTKDDK